MWTAPEQARPPARKRSLTANRNTRKGSRPQRSPVRSQRSSAATDEHRTDGRTCNDARHGRRDRVQESSKHPNYTMALGSGCRCGLVVVASMVQRARATGDGEHALLPTEAAMGPAQNAGRSDENSECVRRSANPANRPASCAQQVQQVSLPFVRTKVECKRALGRKGRRHTSAIRDVERRQGPRQRVRRSQKGRSAEKQRAYR